MSFGSFGLTECSKGAVVVCGPGRTSRKGPASAVLVMPHLDWLNFRPSLDSKGITKHNSFQTKEPTFYNETKIGAVDTYDIYAHKLCIHIISTSIHKTCKWTTSLLDPSKLLRFSNFDISATTIYNAHPGLLGSRHFEESVTSASEMMQHVRATTLTPMILAF